MYCAVDIDNNMPFRSIQNDERGVRKMRDDDKKPVRVRRSRAKSGGDVKDVTCVWNINNHHLECYSCGQTYDIGSALPAPIEMVSAVAKIFYKTHKRCPMTEEGVHLREAAVKLHKSMRGSKDAVSTETKDCV